MILPQILGFQPQYPFHQELFVFLQFPIGWSLKCYLLFRIQLQFYLFPILLVLTHAGFHRMILAVDLNSVTGLELSLMYYQIDLEVEQFLSPFPPIRFVDHQFSLPERKYQIFHFLILRPHFLAELFHL